MKRIAFLLSCLLCLIACSDELVHELPVTGTRPQIELRMQNTETVHVYSAATENECVIDSIWVLVFDSSTKALKTAEHIGGDKIAGNGYAVQLMPQLSITMEVGDSVVCIANTDPNPDTANVKLNTINACFRLADNEYYYGTERLPMYGAMEWSTTNYTCRMIRAVAKVQIQMGEAVTDVTGTFSAENISYVHYDGAAGGYIQPIPGVIQGIPLPSYNQITEVFYLLQKQNATEKELNAYFYEYSTSTQDAIGNSISDTGFNRYRHHILLTKDNSSQGRTNTYYRLDFYDAATRKYFDLKRNHHYLFTINKVRSEGYATPSEAKSNPGSNIEYTIRVSDETSVVKSNGQYAIVTSVDTAYVSGVVANNPIAFVRYEDPSGALNASVNSITVKSGSVNSGGTLTVNSPTLITATNTQITVTANAAFDEGIILFKLGNIEHELAVKRIPEIN